VKGRKLRRKRKLSKIQWLSLIGKKTPDISKKKRIENLLIKKSKCSALNGKRKQSMKERWKDRSSSLIERGTLN